MSRWAFVGTWLAALAGLGFLGYHYARQPAVWHDEGALLGNVVRLNFAQLAGPLYYHATGSLLFLWVERAVIVAFGEGLLVVRLPSFLAGCLSLPLLAVVARRWMSAAAAFWVVALFACSETLAWHSCEAKPYSIDIFCTLVVLALYARLDHQSLARRCLIHAAVAPFLLALSYPACFVHGGLMLALLPTSRERTRLDWLGYGLLAAAIGATFLGVVLPITRAQHDPVVHSDWTRFFPDWGRPLSVPGWVLINAIEVMRYCCKPHGQLLVVPLIVGVVHWWRQHHRRRLLVCLAPLGLALLAAGLHRYPFGGMRVQVYATPLLLLVGGGGIDLVLQRWREKLAWLPLSAGAYLLLISSLNANGRVISPWSRPDTQRSCGWVREHFRPGDVVVGNDWAHTFYLHTLGDDFRLAPDAVPQDATRVWVVWTEQVDASRRLTHLRTVARPDWEIDQRWDFESTTVVLLRPPQVIGRLGTND
jgi:hypothetical protein